MAQFGSRTVAPASRSHFQIFYSDYMKGNVENRVNESFTFFEDGLNSDAISKGHCIEATL